MSIRKSILALLLLTAAGIRADVGAPSVSADFDAEFARAADLLEAGRRPEAAKLLEGITQKSAQAAWSARAAFLLALDDLRREDSASAADQLDRTPAVAIGLEPYREFFLGRALAGGGKFDEAVGKYRACFETEEPFAMRLACGRALALLLEKGGDRQQAARILAKAAAMASDSEVARVASERVRLGLAVRDARMVREAARDLLLAGVEPTFPLPAATRRALREEERRLSASERARRGSAMIAAGNVRGGVRLLEQNRPALLVPAERDRYLLALARGLARLGKARQAESVAAQIAEDATEVSFEAKLLRADLWLAWTHQRSNPLSAGEPLFETARRSFLALTSAPAPLSVRVAAREHLVRLGCEADRFEEALEQARALTRESPGTVSGFEPLWKLAWDRYRLGDFSGARGRLEALAGVYDEIGRNRRLMYWRARCLEREGHGKEAISLFESLAGATPADLYALFSRRRASTFRVHKPPHVGDPADATAAFRRADELLRLRLFEEAAAEARSLEPSRGRDLRLAEAEFGLGKFFSAASSVKRAFPEIGTAEEGRVPDAWRRLFYPIEEGGFLADRAREFGLDPAVLRGLVRQESVFQARAKSRAGALGLTQLLPSTARSVARSILRVRYRRAFLYDPGVNARIGAAYLRRLYDEFGENPLFALAAYNGGPARIIRLRRENPTMEDDELFESHPVYETRDYVRRVLLYAESYRALYP